MTQGQLKDDGEENCGVQLFPEVSTPQWKRGVVSALYVLQFRVLFACISFLETLRNFIVYVCARTCAHVHCMIYACNCSP